MGSPTAPGTSTEGEALVSQRQGCGVIRRPAGSLAPPSARRLPESNLGGGHQGRGYTVASRAQLRFPWPLSSPSVARGAPGWPMQFCVGSSEAPGSCAPLLGSRLGHQFPGHRQLWVVPLSPIVHELEASGVSPTASSPQGIHQRCPLACGWSDWMITVDPYHPWKGHQEIPVPDQAGAVCGPTWGLSNSHMATSFHCPAAEPTWVGSEALP